MQPAQCMLLFLVLAGNSTLFRFYVVTHSYSSRPFLCALATCQLEKHMHCMKEVGLTDKGEHQSVA